MITVRDVIGLALPAPTRVVAGDAGLDREVTWATRLRPTPPAFGHLSGGELVLVPSAVLELLDERLTLEAAVRQLAGFGVAAIAHAGEVSPEARAAAGETGVPLLQLPADADLGALEREASRVITERRRAVQRRGQEVGRRLMELAIAGEPLSALVRGLADLAGRAVALEGRDGRLLASHSPDAPDAAPEVAPLLARGPDGLVGWLRTSAAGSPAEPPTMVADLDNRWARVVAPVIGRDGLLGSLSLIVPRRAGTPEDQQLASRGAAACAVVLARDQAAASARREVELNVLDEVLDGALRSEVSLLQQARRLGHDLEAPHVALVARFDPRGDGPVPVRGRDGRWTGLDELVARTAGPGAGRDGRGIPLWRVRNNSAEIIWPAATPAEADRITAAIFDGLAAESRGASPGPAGGEAVSVGVGRPGAGLEGIRRSHQEARQALHLGRRLHGPGRVTRFDELGVYRLILAAAGLPDMRAFHDETLGPLLTYDRQHGAELIRTLEAYFAANCGPKEAAGILHVHRNTVLYRLERIGEITGLALDDPDVRLRLQLALRIHLAVFSSVE